MTCYRTS